MLCVRSRTLIEGVLPHCSEAVGEFYSPNRLGHSAVLNLLVLFLCVVIICCLTALVTPILNEPRVPTLDKQLPASIIVLHIICLFVSFPLSTRCFCSVISRLFLPSLPYSDNAAEICFLRRIMRIGPKNQWILEWPMRNERFSG